MGKEAFTTLVFLDGIASKYFKCEIAIAIKKILPTMMGHWGNILPSFKYCLLLKDWFVRKEKRDVYFT